MKIDFEKKENLLGKIKMQLTPEDYSANVENSLRALKSKVNVPGFRPGMVPMGMVKKLYGKAVLSDEIGKITTDALFKYLEENDVKYLGQPLPSDDQSDSIDWENQTEFDFYYDLGLAPEFDVNIELDKLISYQIEVDNDVVELEITKLRERNGRNINPDAVEKGDFVMGEATELDENGEIKDGGLVKSIYVFTDKIEKKDAQEKLLNSKVGDEHILNVKELYKDNTTAGVYLGVTSEEVDDLSDKFSFQVATINRMIPAEVDQELFDKVFGEGKISDENEFKDKLKEYLKNDLQVESNAMLLSEIRDGIINKNEFELPDEFLKRWLLVKNQENEKVNVNEILDNYEDNKRFIRWELIRNRLIDKYQLNVEESELMDAAKVDVINRVSKMGYQLPEERIEEFAKTLLSNQEELDKLSNSILENKALRKLREDIEIDETGIGYNDFLEKLKETQPMPQG